MSIKGPLTAGKLPGNHPTLAEPGEVTLASKINQSIGQVYLARPTDCRGKPQAYKDSFTFNQSEQVGLLLSIDGLRAPFVL